MNTETQKKMCEFINLAGGLVGAAAKQASDQDEIRKKIAGQIPKVVEALVKNKRLDASLSKDAEALLADHSQTLDMLARTAAHRTDDELALGKPIEKKASVHGNQDNPWCGDRRGTGQRESDRLLAERFGIK